MYFGRQIVIIWFSRLSDKGAQIGVDSTARPFDAKSFHKRSIVPERYRLAARRAVLALSLPYKVRQARAGLRRARPCAYRSAPPMQHPSVHPDLQALRLLGYTIAQ